MDKKRTIIISLVCVAIIGSAFLLSGCGKAQDGGDNQGGAKQSAKQAPDQAMQNKAAGGPNGAQTGQNELSVAACKDKSAGDSCEMSLPARPDSSDATDSSNAKTVSGTCKMKNDQLGCVPANMPAPPAGNGSASDAK